MGAPTVGAAEGLGKFGKSVRRRCTAEHAITDNAMGGNGLSALLPSFFVACKLGVADL